MSDFEHDNKRKAADNNLALPLMSLREVVMFPRSVAPLFVGRDVSIKAIEAALADHNKKIFLVAQREPDLEKPGIKDLFNVGTVSRVLQLLKLPDGTIKVLFEGLYRAKWIPEDEENFDTSPDFQMVKIVPLPDVDNISPERDALVRATQEAFEEYAKINKKITPEHQATINSLMDTARLADAVIPHVKLDYRKKQEVLEEDDAAMRLEKVYEFLQSEISIFNMEKRIKNRVKTQMETNQREYYLNEQIKAINKEMGRDDDPAAEAQELEGLLAEKNMPDENRAKVLREIKKLRHMPPSSAEYAVLRNYIDWVLDLPWNKLSDADIDIDVARKVLNDDHYGLDKPKERILEYLAVQKLSNKLKGPILCFVGPPGVGKTSLAKSVARATGREFVRLSLGGVRDEAEIRGHRRTYVGALPGKIIQSLKRVKFNNPLFCLDEIDKMSMDFRGDPSAALLEVLDPEQNYSFNDHYIDMDYDLSQVFFITTANSLHSIPGPLQDRMEIIQLSSYLETEKKHIARSFLLPKQVEAHGLKPENVQLTDSALLEVIRSYTREAGVRNLERKLAAVCRKIAMRIVEADKPEMKIDVHRKNLSSFLGVKSYRFGEKENKPQVGVCTGLAWTQVGGELLMVETALMPGTGRIVITGKLGEVMTESAQAAFSYIRSRSDVFGLKDQFHRRLDMHVHVPEGATPKDGPSAGITLATSMISALLGIPIRNDIAMTGEITLRGRVLPIGGLREKLLAARRGLINKVIIPRDNEKDLKDVPKEILRGLEIVLVDHIDEVLPQALIAHRQEIFKNADEDTGLHRFLQTIMHENIVDQPQPPAH